MGKRRTLSAAMWRRPLGNPVEYAASSPTRPIALPIFCSISQSRPPPTYPSCAPTMVVGNHVLASLQIACKTISGKCERRMAPIRDQPTFAILCAYRSRSIAMLSPKIVVVNEYIFRSRAWFKGSITILSFLRCPTLMMIGMIRLIIEGNEKNVTIFNLQFCILKEIR